MLLRIWTQVTLHSNKYFEVYSVYLLTFKFENVVWKNSVGINNFTSQKYGGNVCVWELIRAELCKMTTFQDNVFFIFFFNEISCVVQICSIKDSIKTIKSYVIALKYRYLYCMLELQKQCFVSLYYCIEIIEYNYLNCININIILISIT